MLPAAFLAAAAFVAPATATALEYCYLDPATGMCVAVVACPAGGCPRGFECVGGGYGTPECRLIGFQVACCDLTGAVVGCGGGLVCVPQPGPYGACLPARGPGDTAACAGLLLAGGGVSCAADDCDQDGVPNELDPCVCVAGPADDSDGDGAGDACDDCPGPNPDQSDVDGDGAGDACDDDDDGDGVSDAIDDCWLVADPGQMDTDGDGAGDACDPFL